MNTYFADLHIHIGRDHKGKPVKITGARTLTLTKILIEASRRKGIDIVGVIDCHAPHVQEEINELITDGKCYELGEGGIRFENVTLIPGSEIEVYDAQSKGPIHVLCYFPNMTSIAAFTEWLKDGRMKNVNLSSQRYYGSAKELQYKVKELSGLFIPAHIFTPFKSLYGKGVTHSLSEVFDPDLIDAVELGLSSDTEMVNGITELSGYTFLSNSDAHSLQKIAREYQELRMGDANYKEFEFALHKIEERGVIRNFGLHPKLGKYYHTVCKECLSPMGEHENCKHCGSPKVINGVKERTKELTVRGQGPERPPYIHQVPLDYLPKLGPKTFDKLLEAFDTEMNIIHHVTLTELKEVIPEQLANLIIANRKGNLKITPGGGGKYGSVK